MTDDIRIDPTDPRVQEIARVLQQLIVICNAELDHGTDPRVVLDAICNLLAFACCNAPNPEHAFRRAYNITTQMIDLNKPRTLS